VRDLKYAMRKLARSPGFTLLAGMTLALGISASTTIFSLVNAVLLRQLPYEDPGRLVMLWERAPRSTENNVVSPANYLDWEAGTDAFESMSVMLSQSISLTGEGEPEELPVLLVEPSYFRMLGGETALGRTFAEDEGKPETDRVAVLSHQLWQRQFGSDPSIIGEAITLGGNPVTVVGVMPAKFQPVDEDTQLWIAWGLDRSVNYREEAGRYLRTIAKLNKGVPVEQGTAQLEAVAKRLEEEHPQFNKGWGVNVVLLKQQLTAELRPALTALFGAVCFLMLIACANVANLLLARGTARAKEIAIRASMGAERRRLIRQLLVESLLLAGLGGAAGVALSVWGIDAVVAFGADQLRAAGKVAMDWTVLAFATGVSVLTGVISGLAPALNASRVDLNETLRDGGRGGSSGRGSRRLQSAFVVAEVALAVVLMVGAGLMLSSFMKLQSVEPGFQPENLLTLRVSLPRSKYTEAVDRVNFFEQAVAAVETLPGVESASGTVFPPFSGLRSATGFTIVGRPAPPPGEDWVADVRIVREGYFKTLGIPLLRGRTFEARDTADAPRTYVVNEALSKQYWPDENPLGQQMVVDFGDDIPGTVIGVVGNVKHTGLDGVHLPSVYYHHPHLAHGFMTIVARTEVPPETVAQPALAMLRELDPEQPVTRVQSMDAWMEQSVAPERFRLLLLGLFSGSALLLSALGIYGVIALSVNQRRHEVGIRMALGAVAKDVAGMVVWRAVKLAVIGGVIGATAAAGLARLIESLLFDVSVVDPMVYALVVVLIAGVAALASLAPARQAVRVDPLRTLRYE
jgi:putative ABC transport system permease protein